MLLEWFMGEKNKKKQDEIRQTLLGDKQSLDHLAAILEKKLKYSFSEENYDLPNWAYWHADRIGYNRALNHVIKLIKSLEEQSINDR